MKYAFPAIHSIDDIERHRASGLIHEAFKSGRRDNGTVVYDYAYMDNHVFPPIDATPFAALARELRGITFDASTGALLSRPYHKFFNAGEREEVLAQHLSFSDPHHILEKLDGRALAPWSGRRALRHPPRCGARRTAPARTAAPACVSAPAAARRRRSKSMSRERIVTHRRHST
jgi:RNA ligase